MLNNIAIVIPARYKSSRLPNKLMYEINNKPVIQLTYEKVLKCPGINKNNIYIFTDSSIILNKMKTICDNTFMTDKNCKNGTERICKHLNYINKNIDIIVNIQGDEPYIDEKNIKYAINKHLMNKPIEKLFYTTLHQKILDNNYLNSQGCLTVQFNKYNEVMTYSRNVIPGNKSVINNINNFDYYGFTGIYVFNRKYLKIFNELPDTKYQLFEDIEQMKILENGFKIKTFECPYFNEISLNTKEDLNYLLNKYSKQEYNSKKVSNLKQIYNLNINIKMVIFDLDGVFTNSKIYIDENNNIMKCYNGKDTYGIKLLKEKNIKTALITAHKTDCVKYMTHIINRMDDVIIGNYNKIDELYKLMNKYNLNADEIAYIGDDLPDLPCIKKVGLSACPNDAVNEVKKNVNYICNKKGGDGAVREFIEYLLENK